MMFLPKLEKCRTLLPWTESLIASVLWIIRTMESGTERKQCPGFSVNYMVIMNVDELSEHRTANKNYDCNDQNEIQL